MATLTLVAHWISRLGLGGFFLLAGGIKLLDAGAFQQEILTYQIVGQVASGVAAHYLPALEVMVGLGVLSGMRMRVAVLLSGILLAAFIFALSWTWLQGIDLNCGCLGPIDFVEGQPAAIVRDLLLLGMAGILWNVPQISSDGGAS